MTSKHSFENGQTKPACEDDRSTLQTAEHWGWLLIETRNARCQEVG